MDKGSLAGCRDWPFLTSGIRVAQFLASGIRDRQGQQDERDRDLSILLYGKRDLLTKRWKMAG